MIILITGSSHTGKTLLSQKLIEKYHYPSMSLDHLKMGLIRSGLTNLTPNDDSKMTDLLWPIVKEMIKTAIENDQNMIIEGCYIPYDWKTYFTPEYLEHIKFICLVMSSNYIEEHFSDIKKYASVIENRVTDDYCKKEILLRDNRICLEMCKKYGCDYILIDGKYKIDINLNINEKVRNL
ncbi:adenylate kinase [Candidatus Galacturonibacter soehngenii]|uniref:Adenylate kinase n=1 Tax=Candidatus Galacturonatibacter soehngenii TaxID=2307010 RepID=A0A7V7UD15_9FIRM|nr:adenylate kinase [Candidatus Galacturonibacter soehngenii]KAB1440017.1 adenylate kinase [Candidatus Galacturonibacter soehngenii]